MYLAKTGECGLHRVSEGIMSHVGIMNQVLLGFTDNRPLGWKPHVTCSESWHKYAVILYH